MDAAEATVKVAAFTFKAALVTGAATVLVALLNSGTSVVNNYIDASGARAEASGTKIELAATKAELAALKSTASNFPDPSAFHYGNDKQKERLNILPSQPVVTTFQIPAGDMITSQISGASIVYRGFTGSTFFVRVNGHDFEMGPDNALSYVTAENQYCLLQPGALSSNGSLNFSEKCERRS